MGLLCNAQLSILTDLSRPQALANVVDDSRSQTRGRALGGYATS